MTGFVSSCVADAKHRSRVGGIGVRKIFFKIGVAVTVVIGGRIGDAVSDFPINQEVCWRLYLEAREDCNLPWQSDW